MQQKLNFHPKNKQNATPYKDYTQTKVEQMKTHPNLPETT